MLLIYKVWLISLPTNVTLLALYFQTQKSYIVITLVFDLWRQKPYMLVISNAIIPNHKDYFQINVFLILVAIVQEKWTLVLIPY